MRSRDVESRLENQIERLTESLEGLEIETQNARRELAEARAQLAQARGVKLERNEEEAQPPNTITQPIRNKSTNPRRVSKTKYVSTERVIEVGDRVELKIKPYGYGKVVKILPCYVDVRLEASGEIMRKRKGNVTIIDQD